MDSRINLSFEDEDKLINYLKKSFSDNELKALCRSLNLDKDDVFTRNATKNQDCEHLVDAIRQNDYIDKLFFILQSERFFRERLIEEFQHIGIKKPESISKIIEVTKKIHNNSEDDDEDFERWIHSCKEKMVLILGKDSPDDHMKELEKIAGCVKELGYKPILIKQQNEIEFNSNEEKVMAYAAISRFIIIEKSYPAGQIDEAKLCVINRFPSIWLKKEGKGDTWMQGDYEYDYNYLKVLNYKGNCDLENTIRRGIEWVEEFIDEKATYLNKTYPWRKKAISSSSTK